MSDSQTKLTGTIKKLGKDCPKPDGWFCLLFSGTDGKEFWATGKTDYAITVGLSVQITVRETIGREGPQYEVTSIKPDVSTRKGFVAFLSSPMFVGIGKVTALKIYAEFGDKCIDVIKNEPEKLKTLGLTEAAINSLIKGVNHNRTYSDLFDSYPYFKQSEYKAIVDKYGSTALDILTENPYRLLHDFDRSDDNVVFNFQDVDRFTLYICNTIDTSVRLSEAVSYAVSNTVYDSKGSFIDLANYDTYMYLIGDVYRLLCASVPLANVKAHIDDIANCDTVTLKRFTDSLGNSHAFLFNKDDYKIEKSLAGFIEDSLNDEPIIDCDESEIMDYIAEFEDKHNTKLDEIQKSAVINALTNRFSVITGGPGRGKTTIIRCITYCIRCLNKQLSDRTLLLAPTGKAVSKLREVSDYCKDTPLTIDSLLYLDVDSHKKRFVIVDEVSMVGFRKMARLMGKLPNSQFVLIGDANQLPSIDAGDLLRDLCDNPEIPVVRLVNCYRTPDDGQLIIDNADRINNSNLNLLVDNKSFLITPIGDDNVSLNYVLNTYNHYVTELCVDMSDIAVFCPFNKPPFGTSVLNAKLQEMFNQSGVKIKQLTHNYGKSLSTEFRVGDRVIQTKNNKDLGVYNGDVGVIVDYESGASDNEVNVTVLFDNGLEVVYHRGDYEDLSLAYALTIHKSQGSEYKVVILYIPSGTYITHADFLSKNMLYTGVTRAKERVHIIGHSETIGGMILNTLPKRPTALNYFLSGVL